MNASITVDTNSLLPPTTAAVNLRRLVTLRAVTLLVQGSIAWIAVQHLGILLPPTPIAVTLAVAALLIPLTIARLHLAWPVRDGELFAHLVADVLLLTSLLYFSGGSTNPFAPLYLIPVTLCAAALSWRFTWPMLALTSACYSLLLFDYVPLYHHHEGEARHVLDDFHVHVVGTWLGFLLSGGLIAYFAVRMRETVRERDRLRAQIREQELQHERVLALGTFATGAAHELSTPLTTIAVLAKELGRGQGNTSHQLLTLSEQVGRCKEILATLSAAVGQTRAEGGGPIQLDAYVEEIIQRWRSMRAQANISVAQGGTKPTPRIVADLTLSQALLNVLNNAADTAAAVEVDAHWNDTEFVFEVRDRGPGLSANVQEHAGEPFFTTKQPGAGMGLGLFLARSTVERLGGRLALNNRSDGGTVCRIQIPLEPLRLSDA
jgi:two-component system sensor histidine kinase RegB